MSDSPTNPHRERRGHGVMFYVPDDRRKSERSPDYKGFLVLDRDYVAGQKVFFSAWLKPTSIGTNLLSLSESGREYEDWTPQEVQRNYARAQRRKPSDYDSDDFEIPR